MQKVRVARSHCLTDARKPLARLKEVEAAGLLDEPIPTAEKLARVWVDYLVIKNEAGMSVYSLQSNRLKMIGRERGI